MCSEKAQELAYAWESVGMPIDTIAEMHIQLQNKLTEATRLLAQMQNKVTEAHRLFESITCLRAEGVEFFPAGKILDAICKEALKGCDLCKPTH
jgi:hypothetical protein